MRKIVQLAIPTILSMVATFATEVGVIKSDEFYNRSSVRKEITSVYEDGSTIKVKFRGIDSQTQEDQTRRLPAIVSHVGWSHDDQKLCSSEKISARVEYEGNTGDEIYKKEYTRETQIPYKETGKSFVNLLNQEKLEDINIPFGQMVQVYEATTYERPYKEDLEKSSYTKISDAPLHKAIVQVIHEGKVINDNDLFNLPKNTPISVVKKQVIEGKDLDQIDGTVIYQLMVKETSVPKGPFERCYEHKDEWQQKGLKGRNQLRHWYEYFNSTEVTPTIYKLSNEQEIPFITGKTELLLTKTGRDSGRTNKPECAKPHGQGFPANSRIVQ